MTFWSLIDQMTMSGHSFIERITGGKTTWSWSKSTSNFQSDAPLSADATRFGLLLGFVILHPALMKNCEIWGVGVSFFELESLISTSRAFWMCRSTESCLHVYNLEVSATGQFERMWCKVHFSAWHKRQALEFVYPHKLKSSGVLTQFILAWRTNFTMW